MSRSRDLSRVIANNSICPSGVIFPYVSLTPPTGWLTCDGSAVSRTTYASLFGIIGTTYGVGDNSTTFNLPNLSNRIPVGHGTKTIGTSGGAASITPTGSVSNTTLDTSTMPSHTHTVLGGYPDDLNFTGNYNGTMNSDGGQGGSFGTQGAGSSGAHGHGLTLNAVSVEQPWTAFHYIIKT